MSGFSFTEAVSAVQARLRPSGGKSSDDSSNAASATYTLTLPQDSPSESETFPVLDDAKLYALFPSFGFDSEQDKRMEERRRCVRAAIEEMQLNYSLDTKSLGSRSDANRGYAEIVRLLSLIRLQQSFPSGGLSGGGHLSGQLPGDEGQGERGRGAEGDGKAAGTPAKPLRNFETYDLLKAIDRRDMETIMEIRDRSFDLLLSMSGGSSGSSNVKASTPLGYAMGLGKDWEGICIVLIGAMSRFVNQLPDPEQEDLSHKDVTAGTSKKRKTLKMQLDPRTMSRLRKVRTNLKLAIDSSLVLEQTSLLASYCQTLVMSEGNHFVERSVEAVSHPLHARIVSGGSGLVTGSVVTSADPFAVARSAVMQYVTEALRSKRDRIAAVEDYVDNAVGDLVLFALWNAIKLSSSEHAVLSESEKERINPDLTRSLPSYFFARDDRVSSHFSEWCHGLAQALELVHAHADAPKPARHAKMWRRSREIVEALSMPVHRMTSGERLSILRAKIMG